MEGKIPTVLYVKSLDIANAVVQEIHSKRTTLHKLIKQIRYHLFKMKEYIEINYEDGMDFVVVPSQDYVKLHNDFLTRSHYFIKEWKQYEKEHGLCIPEMASEIRSFELVFKMIQLIMDEYDAHIHPDQGLLHIYVLTREVPGLLTEARDLALSMNPQVIADQYYMRRYLNHSPYPRFQNTREFEFKQARANGYPDFEYVREPGFKPWGTEQRRHEDLVPEYQRHQIMTGDIGQSTTPPGPKLERPNIRGGFYPGTVYPGVVYGQPTMNNQSGRKPCSGQPIWPFSTGSNLDNDEDLTRKS